MKKTIDRIRQYLAFGCYDISKYFMRLAFKVHPFKDETLIEIMLEDRDLIKYYE